MTDSLSDGYGLVYVNMLNVKDEQGKPRFVEFYSGKRVENGIDIRTSISPIKSKTWEEIYEFWALIVASVSLAVIALEKISIWLMKCI